MYPFGTIPENLIAFAGFLRDRHAFRIGPREIQDAARALAIVNLADQRAVRHALRPILSATVQDAAAFDDAFTEFFFPGPPGVPQSNLPRPRRDLDPRAEGEETRAPRPAASDPSVETEQPRL